MFKIIREIKEEKLTIKKQEQNKMTRRITKQNNTESRNKNSY